MGGVWGLTENSVFFFFNPSLRYPFSDFLVQPELQAGSSWFNQEFSAFSKTNFHFMGFKLCKNLYLVASTKKIIQKLTDKR